jgi:hypothetical protein
MTAPIDPLKDSHDAVTTPVGVTTLCPQCGQAMPAFETRCSGCGHHRVQATDDEQRELLRRRLQTGVGDAFELLELIGKGGMGVVFRAREKSLDRDVALKVLAFDPLMVPEAFARFEREAKLAARLDHPHIVPIFAVGQGQGIAFYTMRLVRGGSLEELLAKEKKLEPARALKYLREIAAALDYAHSHNIVHRDIKPANVMLGDGDHVFVADFGIARAVGGEAALTSTGVVGSPAYMAPEQWQGQAVDGRADQYAFGILAYEILTGRRPYRDASMHELLRMHLTVNLPDITQDIPAMSHRVGETLARATAKEPKDRFASTTEFVNELDRALTSRATPAQSAPTLVGPAAMSVVAAGGVAAGGGVVVAARPAVTTRKRSPLVPAGIAVLVLGGGFALWSAQRGGEPPSTLSAPAVPETVRVPTVAVPETVIMRTKTAPETVRVAPPTPPPVAGSAATTVGPPTAPSDTAAKQGFIAILHPMTAGSQYMIDGIAVAPRMPPVYPVGPGRHIVFFKGATPTVPPQEFVRVLPGDTVRALFAPATGGGPRGEQLRQQVLERARRLQQQGTDRGGGPPRGGPGGRGGAQRGRGGGGLPPAKRDTVVKKPTPPGHAPVP